MMFELAFQLSLGLMLGAFVGYLPFIWVRARMAKHMAKNMIDAPASGGVDLAGLMGLAGQLAGKINEQ